MAVTLPAAPPFELCPQGPARVESYTVLHDRQGPARLIVVGRLDAGDVRFIANEADRATLDAFAADDGLQLRVWVQAGPEGNRVSLAVPAA